VFILLTQYETVRTAPWSMEPQSTLLANKYCHCNRRMWSCHGWNPTRFGDHQVGNWHVIANILL